MRASILIVAAAVGAMAAPHDGPPAAPQGYGSWGTSSEAWPAPSSAWATTSTWATSAPVVTPTVAPKPYSSPVKSAPVSSAKPSPSGSAVKPTWASTSAAVSSTPTPAPYKGAAGAVTVGSTFVGAALAAALAFVA